MKQLSNGSDPCPACVGGGGAKKSDCPICRGSGVVRAKRSKLPERNVPIIAPLPKKEKEGDTNGNDKSASPV